MFRICDRICLSAGGELVDFVESVDSGNNRFLQRIDHIVHSKFISVVEFYALTQCESIGLKVIGNLAFLSDGRTEAAVGICPHQAFINIEEDTSRVCGLCGKGIKTGSLCGNALDKVSAFFHFSVIPYGIQGGIIIHIQGICLETCK